MRIFGIIAVAAGLALATPALAREKGDKPAAAPAVAPSDAPEAKMIADVAAYTGGYQALLGDASDFFVLYMKGAHRALDGKPGDLAWLDGWMADMRGRLGVLRARRAALGPPPAELLARMRSMGFGEEASDLSNTPKTMGAAIDAVLDLCEQVMTLVPDAARGDQAARTRLTKAMTRGARTALVSENAMMQAGLVRLEPGNPQAALIRSVTASNNALIGLMDLAALLDENPKADPTQLATQIIGNLDTARSEAQKIGPLAQRMAVQLKSLPGDEGLKARVLAALATFDESGQVEVQLVDTLKAMLSTSDPAKAEALNQDLQGLVNRRLQLQTARQAAMGG